ncbi:hypothetical protein MTP99_009881 [Tenebrio molitor]|jgi:hypothetical protein|nr:hypothetical protein MTP99_009881 [Tenebrio molitor]
MGKEFQVCEISHSDCRKVIGEKLKSKDFKVLDHEQIPFSERNGYLGEHCTLRIDIERDGLEESFTFFVKAPPRSQSQRNFLEEINGHFKEKSFFNKYCPKLKKHGVDILDGAVPTCYHIGDEIFIFDDLKALGYDTLPSRAPLTVDCVKAALSASAKLHASGLILEERLSFRLTDEFASEVSETFYSGTKSPERAMKSCKEGLRALIDVTHKPEMKIGKEAFAERVLEGCDMQKVYVRPSTRFRNTICHADPWTKNFLFKFEAGRPINCVVVDFQTYRYGPPAQDVLAFIYLVTDRGTRDAHLDDLLHFYYAELAANMEKYGVKDVVTKTEFFDSCDYFKRFALTQTLAHFQVVILSDEIAQELFGDPDKSERVIFGDGRRDFVVTVWQRDPIFRQKNSEIIADLREFYEAQLTL